MDPTLLLNLISTTAMTGVIWMVQLVHYPLFARVGEDGFAGYHAAHATRISFIVGPLIALEAVTAVLLVVSPHDGLAPPVAAAGLALVVVNLACTAFVHVPQHHRLSSGFDARTHRGLVRANWVRTAAWTLRTVLLAGSVLAA